MRRMKILLIVAVAVVVSIAILATGCGTSDDIVISRDDGLPLLVYNKFDANETSKDLYFYQIGEGSQKIATQTNPNIYIGNDNRLLVYSCRTGDYNENDVYIIDRDGQQQLLDKGVAYYEIAKSGGRILYYYNEQFDTVYIKQYLDSGQIIDVDKINECDSWGINNDASTIVITKRRPADDAEEDVRNMYLYEDGAINIIAENTTYPNHRFISDNDSLLFVTEYDRDAGAGMLYYQHNGEEPQLITESASLSAEISDDGAMIVYITEKEKKKLHCLYNGKELELPDDSYQYQFCRASNTLVYLSSADGDRKLYKIKDGGEPQIISEAEAVAGISADGSCVVYMNNINKDKTEGELYAARDGQQPVLVDTHVSYSSAIAYIFGFNLMFEMNNDGSIIAYCKEYHSDSPTANLYVKLKGEEPIMVDDRVALGFKLF